jgi:hypothetical protein
MGWRARSDKIKPSLSKLLFPQKHNFISHFNPGSVCSTSGSSRFDTRIVRATNKLSWYTKQIPAVEQPIPDQPKIIQPSAPDSPTKQPNMPAQQPEMKMPPKPANGGKTFITDVCTSDDGCQSGCCGFKSGKCEEGPVIAQERDGCGFGNSTRNDKCSPSIAITKEND